MSPYPNEPDPWPQQPDHGYDAVPSPSPPQPASRDTVPEPIEYPTEFQSPDQWAPAYPGSGAADAVRDRPLSHLTAGRIVVAWLVIVFCTVALFFLQALGMKEMAKEAKADSRPGMQALYLGRVGVGFHNIAPGQSGQFLDEYNKIVNASTHPRLAELRGVVLTGELQGRDAAQDRLALLLSGATPLLEDATQPTAEDQRVDGLIERIYTDQSFVPNADQREQLISRHGYFGEIAAGYNLPQSDPLHKGPRRSATIMIVGLGTMVGVVGLAFLTGIVLLVVLAILFGTGSQKIAMRDGPAGHPAVYLELVALFLVGFIVLQLVFGVLSELTGLDWTLGFLLLSPVVLLWPRLAGVPWKQYCHDMGFHRGKGWINEIGSGIGGYLAGLPVIAVGFGMTFLLGLFSGDSADHPMQREITDGRLFNILLLIAAAVVWAPLVEEAVFRSAFYRHLRQWRGVPSWLIATVVTSFIFAAIHPQGWIGIPVLMSIAFVLAALREWRGSIIPSITAHALHNGTLMVLMLIILYV
ncbi:MAG: type II CAAX endopeptidase family protein [Planctomycetota bacterium]